jgi:ferredoxin
VITASQVEAIARALDRHGLMLRGGFGFDETEVMPLVQADRPARSVLLVGQAGSTAWSHFLTWRKTQPADFGNPLDSWAREVIGDVAERFGARAVSPSDKPYLPFQQWAMRAEGLKPSPLGILMHPSYGLWHAYRGALLFEDEIAVEEPRDVIHLCDACDGKPCVKSCPVDAYSLSGFDYEGCLSHVRGGSGGPCRTQGCLDRNACPYGREYRYLPDQQVFHMAAFAGLSSLPGERRVRSNEA